MNDPDPFKNLTLKYNIIDNGGIAFTVYIKNNHVDIYKNDYDWDHHVNIESNKPILSYSAEKIWIGRSPLNKMTEFSGGASDYYDGNSILLKLNKEHIYIGREIYSFQPLAPIAYYISPVGNSGTAYPFAIDKNHNYYLMIENVIMLNHPFTIDPYDDYYNNQSPLMYHDIPIDYIMINHDRYSLHYTPLAAEEYDRLTKNDTLKMVVGHKNKIYPICKNDYIKIMQEYGKKNKLTPIDKKVIVE